VTGRGSRVEAGLRALARGDRREAERLWREALAENPRDERAREYLRWLAAQGAIPAGSSAPAQPAAAWSESAAASAWDEVPSRTPAIALPSQGGLDLAALRMDPGAPVLRAPVIPAPGAPEPQEEVPAFLQGARELFALGDFSGSLELIERVLALEPRNAEALAYLRENEATLVAMYESKLGRLDAIPRVQVRPEEVLWLNLDHRAGFVLAQIDGTLTWDDLFALSALPRLDTARILARLVDDGVVAAR